MLSESVSIIKIGFLNLLAYLEKLTLKTNFLS